MRFSIVFVFSFLLLAAIAGNCAYAGPRQQKQLRLRSPADDSWLGIDKLDHVLLSGFLTGLGYGTLHQNLRQPEKKSLVLAAGFTFTLGVSKELWDLQPKRGHSSFKDLVADLLGIGCAIFLIRTF